MCRSLFTNKQQEEEKENVNMQSVKVEAPVLPPSEQQEVFQSVPVDQQNHPMYQFDPNSMIDPTENFKKFMTQFEEGDIPNIRG